jgi:hypothetical protein
MSAHPLQKPKSQAAEPQLIELNNLQLAESLFGLTKPQLARKILESTYFVDPARAKKSPVLDPTWVLHSKEFHKGLGVGDLVPSTNQQIVSQLQIKNRFGQYIGRRLTGGGREVPVGWEVAHVWGRVSDPEYCTAVWNIVLMPGFLRILCEHQSGIPEFQAMIQAVAYRIYFEEAKISLPDAAPPRPMVRIEGLHLEKWVPKLL